MAYNKLLEVDTLHTGGADRPTTFELSDLGVG